MTLSRRTALITGLAAAALIRPGLAAARFAPRPGAWRRFEVTTRVALATGGAPAQAWVPVPAVDALDWARSGPARWSTNAASATLVTDPAGGARFVHAIWPAGEAEPVLDLVYEAST